MVKYIINGRFLTKQITGVQRYAYEIILELDKIMEDNFVELVVPSNCENIPKFEHIGVNKIGKLKGNLWEQISFPLYVSRKKAIPINLCNTAPLINPGIVCIHDVKIKAKPEYFSKKFLIWYN
ncbi:MAG: hypothetical protein LUH02_09985, partial [Erysipelotrichaceae bacterium]|nr:hypothetical protein [Erysipelotrichaceae bacterium]